LVIPSKEKEKDERGQQQEHRDSSRQDIRALLSSLTLKHIGVTIISADDGGRDTSCVFLDNADTFVRLSSGNTIVQEVCIHPFFYSLNGRSTFDNYSVWERVRRGVGSLQALQKITIEGLEREITTAPDWEAVACILRHIHRPIEFCVDGIELAGGRFNGVICVFDSGQAPHSSNYVHWFQRVVPWRQFGGLFLALTTLPALKSALLTHELLVNEDTEMLIEPLIPIEEDYEASFHDSMTEFLQLPTLWHVKFEMFYCIDQVCRAIANGIGGESHITLLELERCMFPNGGGGGDTIRALQTNTLVSKVRLICNQHSRSMFDALSTVLSVHTSLDQVVLRSPVRGFMNTLDFERSGTWLAPLFLTLAYASRTLKSLKCNDVSPSNKMVMKALGHALRGNSSLEYLAFTLHHDGEVRNMQALQWMVAALKQLRFNASLESLKIDGAMEAGWFVSLVILTGNELGENTSL
jgi:hypothetical protein